MMATKNVVAKCQINDQNPNSFLSCWARFCRKSSTVIEFGMLHFCSSTAASSISLYNLGLGSSLLPPTRSITHCLPKSQGLRLDSTEAPGMSKSVHVKFQMKMECQFGDHILIVGDDPLLGSWNPLNALPFDWSDGHLWTLLLEMPADKCFKYKFLLKKNSGEILWQPGPDRVFISWETDKVIIVSEEWATAEAQMISEAQIIGENEEKMIQTLVDDPVHIVADNITYLASDDNITAYRNRSGANEEAEAHLTDDTSSIESHTNKGITSFSDRSSQNKRLMRKGGRQGRVDKSSSSEAKDSLITSEEGPVLVPGLTVMLTDSENNDVNEQQKSMVDLDAEKAIVNEHQKSSPADLEPRFQIFKNEEYHVYHFD